LPPTLEFTSSFRLTASVAPLLLQDYTHVLALAYGVKGRFKHLLKAAAIEALHPKQSRPLRFVLAPLPGEAGETFSVALLSRLVREARLEDEQGLAREGDGGRGRGDERHGGGEQSGSIGRGSGEVDEETGTKTEIDNGTEESAYVLPPTRGSSVSDASVRLQLAILRQLVPTPWTRRTKHQPAGGDPGGRLTGWSSTPMESTTSAGLDVRGVDHSTGDKEAGETARGDEWTAEDEEEEADQGAAGGGDWTEEEDEEDEEGEEEGDDEEEKATRGGRKRFRQDWMPTPWDVDRTIPRVVDTGGSDAPHSGRRPLQSWLGEISRRGCVGLLVYCFWGFALYESHRFFYPSSGLTLTRPRSRERVPGTLLPTLSNYARRGGHPDVTMHDES